MPAVLAGDYNVGPTDQDSYDMRFWTRNALVQPEPRAAFFRLLAQGWTDALGDLHSDERSYTFSAYLRDAWPRDAGLRIDHLLVSASLVGRFDERRGRTGAARPRGSQRSCAGLDRAELARAGRYLPSSCRCAAFHTMALCQRRSTLGWS